MAKSLLTNSKYNNMNHRMCSMSKCILFVLSLSINGLVLAQTRYTVQNATVTISGTSSLHDWKETSTKGSGVAVFTISSDKITALNGLSFVVPVKSVKSEHKAMDNNTYNALKADKNPNIVYTATKATVTAVNANTFTITTSGNLTIAGTTKVTDVVATAKINPDKSITISGNKKFKMTDFNVKPPTAVLGTIKTGNDITIGYQFKFTDR